MNRLNLFLTIGILTSIGGSWVYASQSALEKVFKTFGGQVNHTSPGSFHDQAAGYYSGGGVVMRTKDQVVNPIRASLPRFNAGCEGFDAFFGAFSVISGAEIGQLLQNVGSGIMTYGLQLALKTMAPQVENLMSQLRKIVMDANAMMLNKCQLSQTIVGGLLPKGTTASAQICEDLSRESYGEDWFGARTKHCKDQLQVTQNVEKAKSDERNKHLLQGEYNLTWLLAKELNFDEETAHFMLTALGSVVSKREGDRFVILPVDGQAESPQFLSAYIKGGGPIALRRCRDRDKCLEVVESKETISAEKSLKFYFQKWIDQLIDAYIDDKPPSNLEETRALLSDTAALPLYSYIQVAAITGSRFMMGDAAEYLALQIMLTRLNKLSTDLLAACEYLRKVQLEPTVLEQFIAKIRKTRALLTMQSSQFRGDAINHLTKTIQAIETAEVAKEG